MMTSTAGQTVTRKIPILGKHAADRYSLSALVLLLLVAFAAGGGGSGFALANLVVQLTAIAVLAFQRSSFVRFWMEAPLTLRIAIAVSLMLPLVQIIPLPEHLWSALPGRQMVARALDMTGTTGWMPMSVDPRRTLLALTALITPLAVLIAGWALPRHRLIDLGWLVVALGLLTVLLGAVQLGSGTSDVSLFGSREPGTVLLGTFANRNSTGLLLGFALGLAALLPAPHPDPALRIVRLAICVLLLLAIILTKSRTGLVLGAIPIGLGVMKAVWWHLHESGTRHARYPKAKSRSAMVVIAAIAVAVTGAAALVALAPDRISATFERFQAKDDPRRFIWDDASYAVARYWPAGAGMGTFDEVFQVDESLENLTLRRAGRAHNDYIELAIEAGAAGLLLAACWVLLIAWLSWRARLSPQHWVAWAGGAFLFAIALQSITDYPLRNQTILAFAGFALLLLARGTIDRSRTAP